MARNEVKEMSKRTNKSFNLASAPRSTEVSLSHGHATSNELNGTVVPNTEVNLAEGQTEQSIKDTKDFEHEANVRVVEDNDVIQNEMLKSISTCALPMGTLDGLLLDDSSDLGFLKVQGVKDLCDGDLATADLQPGHLLEIQIDRRMMTVHELDHAQTTRRLRAEHAGDRAPTPGSLVNHGWVEGSQESNHPPRTSRSGQFKGSGKFYGLDAKPGQPGNCCHTFLDGFTSTV